LRFRARGRGRISAGSDGIGVAALPPVRWIAAAASALTLACSPERAGEASPPPEAGAPEAEAGSDAAAELDPCLRPPSAASGSVYWVSISGSDASDGSAKSPWATISHALGKVADGATIVVRPGRYEQRVRLDRRFEQGVVVRAEQPYRSRLRHSGTVVRAYYGAGITLEGFDIAHTGLEVEPVLVHIQDLVDGPDAVERIVLRNNVIHDARAGDLVKINNGARRITLERNLFFNQAGTDEQVDIDSATDILVQDNVFFNDFAGSGRYNDNLTGSFVAVKGGSEELGASRRITIRRNLFTHWEGSPGAHFVLLGGWGKPWLEAEDVLIENNLMIGNSKNKIRAPLGIKGAIDVVYRHNTVVGNLPGAAYALRMVREGETPPNDNIRFYNNIWSDPTRTMYDFSDTPPEDTTSFLLSNNLYYNGGAKLPGDDAELVNIWDDARRIMEDPMLPDATTVSLPLWDAEAGRFADGSASICGAFTRLVASHCRPAPGSPAFGVAWAEQAPDEDLMQVKRIEAPDVGACQRELHAGQQ
jgi:hypothetical protein